MTIDIWLISGGGKKGEFEADSSLSVLLGFVLGRTDIWRSSTHLRILSLVQTPSQIEAEYEIIESLRDRARIEVY